MNSQIKEFYDINVMYTQVRDKMMEILTDDDLSHQLSEAIPTLGALCKEIGETEYAYVQSFKTFKTDFSYRNPDSDLSTSVEKLRTWYKQLDADLKVVLEAITDDDVANKKVDRGDFSLTLHINLDVYREALLIFYGKASVYLKSLGKPLPEIWQHWIG